MMSTMKAMTIVVVMVKIGVISNQKFYHYCSFDILKCCSIKTDDDNDGDDDSDDRIDECSLANLVGCVHFCPRL